MAKISGLTMNNYYGISSSGASTLFGSLSANGASSIATLSSDYANIKSGAYGKLLKTYYSQNANKLNNNTTSDVKKSEKTDTSQMVLERDSAKELKESASKLTSTDKDSLFADYFTIDSAGRWQM